MSRSNYDYLPDWYTFELYPEDFSNQFDFTTLQIVCSRNCYEFAFIVHKPESDDKKEHVHVLCYNTKSQQTAYWLSRLPSASAFRSWQPVKHPCQFARYMLHQTDDAKKDGKTPYERSSVVCSSDEWFDSLLNGSDINVEDDKVQNALSILADARSLSCGQISLQDFIKRHPEAIYRMGQVKALVDFDASMISRESYNKVVEMSREESDALHFLRSGIASMCGDEAYYAFIEEGKRICEK